MTFSAPTICINCKNDDPPLPRVYGGRHYCLIAEEKQDFVTGEGLRTKPLCALKNASGNCPDFEAKEA